jgi:ATP-dependent Lon protease
VGNKVSQQNMPSKMKIMKRKYASASDSASDSDSDSTYQTESSWETEEDDEYDSEDEDDEESDEEEDDEENSGDEESNHEEEDEESEEHEQAEETSEQQDKSNTKPKEEEFDYKNFHKLLYKNFPSNYMKNKVKKEEEEEEEDKEKEGKTSDKKESRKQKTKDTKPSKQDKKKETKSSDKKQSSSSSKKKKTKESKNEDKDDEEEEDRKGAKDFSIIFTSLANGDSYYEEDIEQVLNDDNEEECNSDDEQTFMKENYEKITMPTDTTSPPEQVLSKHKKKTKKNKKSTTPSKDVPEQLDVEGEYLDLIELKKHIAKKLEKKPNSKILLQTYHDCQSAIHALIKKARTNNAKAYYKLINIDQEDTSEIKYFKTKLSHKEQEKAMAELKEINSHIHVDKPYRLMLLQSKIPLKYKATVMQKLNTMESMEPGDPEYYKLKNWVDTFMRVPFGLYKNLSVTINDGIDVCSSYMVNAKKTLDDCVYGLDDAKMQTLQMIGQWITNPSALGTAIAIHGPPGTGKCLGLNTPILMYDGSIKMVQEVQVGDFLMGDDSTPRTVLSLATGVDDMYDIISKQGEKYTVNSEHILSLKPSGLNRVREIFTRDNQPRYKVCVFNKNTYKNNYKTFKSRALAETYLFENSQGDDTVDISVKDYLAIKDNSLRQALKGYKTAIEFPSKSVMFNPYIIGLWLGDGTSSKAEITSQDSKILHYLQHELRKDNLCLRYGRNYEYSIVIGDRCNRSGKKVSNKFAATLRHYNLFNNKHIPNDYKINDRRVQLQILAGLLDTDGYYDKRNNLFEITQKNKRLSDDILYIARSLGFGTSQTKVNKSCMYKGEKREGSYYRVNIFGDGLDEIPTLCTRKRAFNHQRNKNQLVNDIDVLPVGRDNYYGFEIDGNKRFVLGDFTVTHNTSIVKDGISKILGREFAFIALGGAGDSSFLEGHSYTYEGSMWGKIVQILIDSKCMNPVIYFDELDKVSDTPRGQEIINVLMHLTDTTQNSQFHDKYFSEVDFDLSKCLFIFSYNDESLVNPILRDRMYRIQTKGYDTKEKIHIARKYILPKIREQVNFDEKQVIIPDETISYIVSNTKFTQNEQGVRNLKRCLEIIHTKLNLFRLVNDPDLSIFGNKLNLKVTFPFTVTRECVDILIKCDENQNQSLLAMYV